MGCNQILKDRDRSIILCSVRNKGSKAQLQKNAVQLISVFFLRTLNLCDLQLTLSAALPSSFFLLKKERIHLESSLHLLEQNS